MITALTLFLIEHITHDWGNVIPLAFTVFAAPLTDIATIRLLWRI